MTDREKSRKINDALLVVTLLAAVTVASAHWFFHVPWEDILIYAIIGWMGLYIVVWFGAIIWHILRHAGNSYQENVERNKWKK